MRKFEVVKRCKDDNVNLPVRSTTKSAGYDFESVEDVIINPKETVMVRTGVKALFGEDEVLLLFNRSSLGAKRHLMLVNGVGVIDADYYNNSSNEGEIAAVLYNFGEIPQEIKKGERIAQGVFVNYLKTIDDDPNKNLRSGGFGSSGK